MLLRAARFQRLVSCQSRKIYKPSICWNRTFSPLGAPRLLPASMKRKAPASDSAPKAKRQKEPEKDYCDVETRKDDDGSVIWPAAEEAIANARAFLKEWYEQTSKRYLRK